MLTSNRDESVLREPAWPPALYTHSNHQVMYPKDPKGGGTWLATSSNHFTLCLLNGAFERHVPNPPYRQSRGLVVTDFFKYNDVDLFVRNYLFTGIEPFTLVMIQHQSVVTIHELRWDGKTVYVKTIDGAQPQIWSSATLYDPEVIAARKEWFADFLTMNIEPGLQDMLSFHHFGGSGDSGTDILMNRNNILRTISITAVKVCETGTYMLYEDIVTDKITDCELPNRVNDGNH